MHGSLDWLIPEAREYVLEKAMLCQPDKIHVCDGSEAENAALVDKMVATGTLKKITSGKFENCYLALTDKRDIARVERKTYICTEREKDAVPTVRFGSKAFLGNWMSIESMEFQMNRIRFPSAMLGRTMYVIPYSMGPVGSPLAKYGLELTDSPYVVSSMRIMTRMGKKVLDHLKQSNDKHFIRSLHSVGRSLGMLSTWPCDPDNTLIAHFPDRNEICSYGSGYGGNSLLGKKCFALRIASNLGKREKWLAEHMLILGITNPEGKKKFIAAAFPSACGKTNLAMLKPTLPGWKVECVGDDIAWMRFDDEGNLRAINPESGFFGVVPGTSMKTNPYAMKAIHKNTIFTNVAMTKEGDAYWEGMEDEDIDLDEVEVTSWDRRRWTRESEFTAAHKNSRFCTPAHQLEIIDPQWEDPKGVPIEAILFGGRRERVVPLVYESNDWTHGVFVGASMRSLTTAASLEGTVRKVNHDPFAMRPFFGYNCGHYFQHWLDMANTPKAKLPKIFYVNWFRKEERSKLPAGQDPKFLWPGFGENSRVLEWIFRRTENEDVAIPSPIGLVPKYGALKIEGLTPAVDMEALFAIRKDDWQREVQGIREFFEDQLPEDLPKPLWEELKKLEANIEAMP